MLDSGHATLADLHNAWKDVRQRIEQAGARYAKATDLPPPIAPPIVAAPPLPELEPYCPPLSIKVLISTEPTRFPSIDLIQEEVGLFYGFTKVDLCSQRRTDPLCRARHIGFFISRRMTLNSLPAIGLKWGKKDHTTVLHGVQKIEKRMMLDVALAAEVGQIEINILARCH